MKNQAIYTLIISALLGASVIFTSCEKVSPTGVLIGNTSVDDRVKQSLLYYSLNGNDFDMELADSIEEYSFLVGSDSHITTDPGRLAEMFDIGLEHDDLFFCHLGDLADTKAEYYENTEFDIQSAARKWRNKYLKLVVDEYYSPEMGVYRNTRLKDGYHYYLLWDDYQLPFFPVVGNHDITHNGWALFCHLFHTSFYEFTVKAGNCDKYDRFIFLDSANGTLGDYQIDKIESELLSNDEKEIRNTFVFTHTNIFRPSLNEFASTYCREELYYILDKLSDWNTTIMFYGHVHAWDDRMFGGVRHITMPSMNFVDHPDGGHDLLVRITVKKDGSYELERVGLFSKERSKEELERQGYHTSAK